MRSITCIIFIMFFSCIFASSIDPMQSQFKVVKADDHQIDIEFSLPDYHMETVTENGIVFQKIVSRQGNYTIKEGFPELPIFSTSIAIPYHGSATAELVNVTTENLSSFLPYPSQSRMEEANSPKSFQMDQTFYKSASVFPGQNMVCSEPQIMREFRIINLTIQPFTYSAKDKKLNIANKMMIRVRFNDEPGVNQMDPPCSYSLAFEPLYRALISNYDDFRDIDAPYSPEKILFIRAASTDQTFLNKFNDLVLWKKQKGYAVSVASTTETGTTTTSIKAYLLSQYNNLQTRPDYVILVGDTGGPFGIPNWTHSWNYYNGETDYPYTHLSGNDLLGDVFIGRISIESTNDFLNLVAKGFTYEKIIPTQQATWLNKMLLVGDTSSSGISTIYTNKFIKELSYSHNPNYTYNEVYSGSFATSINAGLNQGVGFWNYRGYIGMSGWSPTSSIVNGNKIPHAVIITCGTGSYGGTSATEGLIRLGTANNPAGSVTAIGMSTSGTHTALNNCLAGSIFEGLFTYNMHTMGQALLYAKLYLNSIYIASDPTLAVAFAHICNLMGDPTVEAFKGIPERFSVEYPTSVPIGTGLIPLRVLDISGHSIDGAHVTLSQGNVILFNGISEVDGRVYASIPVTLTGQIILTISKQEYYPTSATIDINTQGALVYDSMVIDDDDNGSSTGNGNGQVNAGETIELSINLKNTSPSTITDIGGDLVSSDPDVQISNISSSYNDIVAGATVVNNTAYVFSVAPGCPDHKVLRLTLQLLNGVNLPILLEVRNGDLDISNVIVNDNGNHVLDPGETSILNVTIKNNGVLPIIGLQGSLTSTSNLISIQDSTATFGDVAPGTSISSSANTFAVHGQLQLVRGMKIPLILNIYNDFGYSEQETLILDIGQVTVNDPFGPDNYGYLIYDLSDTGYPDVPDYNWAGIAPAESGSGTLLAFNDVGSDYDEGDAVGATTILPVSLPFSFSFYGVLYQSLSVCSNGFITFTNSQNGDFRNWHLPGALGPNAMVAAFWDDLILLGGSGVYTYDDSVQHRFIIEWYMAKNGYNRTSEETFEIILYDPNYYASSTGDGQIKIQYKVFNNVDTGGGGSPQQGNYCTIGLKDHTGLRGLEYSFNNLYPSAAAPISNNKALLITGIPILSEAPHLLLGETVIMDGNSNQITEPGEVVDLGIRISNMGSTAAQGVNATISSTDAYVTIINATSPYDLIAGQSTGINKNYFRIQISPSCPDEHVITLIVDITAQQYSWQRYAVIRVSKPSLEFANIYLNDLEGNNNGQANPSENFKVVMNISNPSTVDAVDVAIAVTTNNTNLSIINPNQNIERLKAGKTMQVILDMSLSANVTEGIFIPVQYQISSVNSDAVNGAFSVGVSTTGIFNNFEANNGGFTSGSGWMWGTSSVTGGHSGRNMWGTSLNSEYPGNADFVLTTPSLMIGSNAQLKFWHKYGCESTYDGGNVSISTNNGSTYTLITPEGGYPASSVSSLPEPCYNGSLSEWTQAVFSLSQFANQEIKIKWHFCSDSIINGIGWFIDDLEITGYIIPTGLIHGNVDFANFPIDYRLADVHAGNFDTKMDSLGYYQLFVPNGTYTVRIDMPSYQSLVSSPVTINNTNQSQVVDFYMNYLPNVTAIYYQVSNHHLNMSWNPPASSDNLIVNYNIFRRIDADRFLLVSQTPNMNYTEAMQITGAYSYYVTATYQLGESTPSDTISFLSDATGTEDNTEVPTHTALTGNYPNPFNPETHIRFALAKSEKIRLDIYNIRGQLIRTLANGNYPAGNHQVTWDGKDQNSHSVGSGMYLYRLSTPTYKSTQKAILLK